MLKFHNNLSAYCTSGGLEEHYISAPLRGSIFTLSRGIFGQSRSFQKACVPIGCSTQRFLATDDAAS